jgi:erythromycin esterase-like protein
MASSSTDGQSSGAKLLKTHAIPLPAINSGEFAKTFHQFADCKVLLIGDATHGTHEFYEARAAITKHMIAHHGFDVVAIEADWPDAEVIDRYVRRRPAPATAEGGNPVEKAFLRFPAWVWRNREMHDFIEWLREFNKGKGPTKSTGFYGLDLYSMDASMNAVINYLARVDGQMAQRARTRYGRLRPWLANSKDHDLDELVGIFRDYEGQLVEMLRDLLSKRSEYARNNPDEEEFITAEQNAKLVAGKYLPS